MKKGCVALVERSVLSMQVNSLWKCVESLTTSRQLRVPESALDTGAPCLEALIWNDKRHTDTYMLLQYVQRWKYSGGLVTVKTLQRPQ